MSATPLTPCPVCGVPRLTFRHGPCRRCAGGTCGRLEVPDDPARDYDGDARPYPPRPLPCQPTDTEPGTAARVDVLAARAARGEALWHPGDRRHCEGMVGHPEQHVGEHGRARGPQHLMGQEQGEYERHVYRLRATRRRGA